MTTALLWLEAPDIGQQAQIVRVGQAVVEQHDIDVLVGVFHRLDRGRRVVRLDHRVALLAERFGDRPANQRFILDDENAKVAVGHERGTRLTWIQEPVHPTVPVASGSSTVTVVPPPGGQSIRIVPWWASTRRLAVGSPRPVPRDLVVKNGVKIFSRISGGIPGPASANATRHAPAGHADRHLNAALAAASHGRR